MAEDKIKKHIDAGRRYLLVELNTGTAMLGTEKDAFRRPGGDGLVQFIVVDLAEMYRKFLSLKGVGDREEFTLAEVATIAGTKNHTVNYWIAQGVLTPSLSGLAGKGNERRFSRTDAFCAGLIGSFCRKNLPLALLKDIANCLCGRTRDAKRANKSESVSEPMLK